MRKLFAVAFAITVLAVPAVFAQGGGKTTGPVPYQSQKTSGVFTTSNKQLALPDEVPAGKRLIVEHVSVVFQVSSSTTDAQSYCYILGNTPGSVASPTGSQFIPLQSRVDATKTIFFAGSPLKIYFDAGQVKVDCVVTDDATNEKNYVVNVSGQLVSAQ
ncbi:MAG: hypothetical protein ACE145_03625 [Terriglobia bacterium]